MTLLSSPVLSSRVAPRCAVAVAVAESVRLRTICRLVPITTLHSVQKRDIRVANPAFPPPLKNASASLLAGSCNGLQHYAALGLDAKGGAQVNLVPGDKPGDVYTGVCNVVKQKVPNGK